MKPSIRGNAVRALRYKSSMLARIEPWETKPSSFSAFVSAAITSDVAMTVDSEDVVEESSEVEAVFSTGCCMVPHPDKLYKGGEDACYISPDERVLAVFDGVGAWSNIGVDPGLYSKNLASECGKAYEKLKATEPLALLEKAWLNSQHITGSSTACCLVLSERKLKAANLGDSGFLVIRRTGKLVHYQKEQQHGFNFPYQLGTGSTDEPDDADMCELDVEDGDVVVVATDGVLDNLFPEEIVQIVKEGKIMEKTETEIANRIAKIASQKAQSEEGRTPFSVSATGAGHVYSGGKMDDISVIVGSVSIK